MKSHSPNQNVVWTVKCRFNDFGWPTCHHIHLAETTFYMNLIILTVLASETKIIGFQRENTAVGDNQISIEIQNMTLVLRST